MAAVQYLTVPDLAGFRVALASSRRTSPGCHRRLVSGALGSTHLEFGLQGVDAVFRPQSAAASERLGRASADRRVAESRVVSKRNWHGRGCRPLAGLAPG